MNQTGLPTPPLPSGPSSSTSASHPALPQGQSNHQPQPSSSELLLSLEIILQRITTEFDPNVLNEYLRSLPRDIRDIALAGTLPNGEDPLGILEVRASTIGMMYILCARLHSPTLPPPTHVIDEFCSTFNPIQARLAPDRVTAIAKGIVVLAESMNNPKYSIQPLCNLLTRFPPSLSYLTPIHRIFLTACISTRHFSSSLSVLSVPISIVDTSLCPDLHYNDSLVYHYAGGIALAALKSWEAAEDFFEIVVGSPAQAPAAIQMEALKKLVLVQLISKGKTDPPPKYTHPLLLRIFKTTPYTTFVNHYPQQRQKLREVAEKERQLFTTEKTMGLIMQAIECAPRWSVGKLTAIYLTLSLSEIGNAVGIESNDAVRALILNMIESDELSARLSGTDTVVFSDPPPRFTKADVDRVLRQTHEQGALLEKLEREMARSRDFLTKAVRSRDDNWGTNVPDDDMAGMFGNVSGGAWAEEAIFT